MNLCIVESCVLKSMYDELTKKYKKEFSKIYYSFQKGNDNIYSFNIINKLSFPEWINFA